MPAWSFRSEAASSALPIALPRARVPEQLIRRLCGTTVPLVTIVEIPIVSGTGDVIERHVGWMACGAESTKAGGSPPALVRRARALGARARPRLLAVLPLRRGVIAQGQGPAQAAAWISVT